MGGRSRRQRDLRSSDPGALHSTIICEHPPCEGFRGVPPLRIFARASPLFATLLEKFRMIVASFVVFL